MLFALLTTGLFACSSFSGGRISRMLGGFRASFYRTAIAVLLLALAVTMTGADVGMVPLALIYLIVSGVIGFGLGDMSLYRAYERIGPRLAVLICQCVAVPIALFSEWIWIGTVVTGFELLFILLILAGVLLALAPRDNPHLPVKRLLAGLALGLVAAFGQGFGAVLSRRAYEALAQYELGVDPLAVTFLRLSSGFLFLIVYAAATRGLRGTDAIAVRRSAPWLMMNASAGPFFGVIAYQYALSIAPSGPVLAIVATTPIFVMPLTVIFDGDRPTARAIFGSMLAVGGVIGLLLT